MVVIYYRGAHLMHYLATETARLLLPLCTTATEMLVILTFFLAIRLNADGNDKLLVAVSCLAVGAMSFYNLKQGLEFASKVTESSRDFSQVPFLQKGYQLAHKDKVFLASCKPLETKVGVFTITKESFPTISHEIILGNLVSLLVTF